MDEDFGFDDTVGKKEIDIDGLLVNEKMTTKIRFSEVNVQYKMLRQTLPYRAGDKCITTKKWAEVLACPTMIASGIPWTNVLVFRTVFRLHAQTMARLAKEPHVYFKILFRKQRWKYHSWLQASK